MILNEAPGWLRLLYIKEILPRFVRFEDDGYSNGDKFSGPIYITGLAEKLCIMLKTELPRDGYEWEYIRQKIKRCHWQEFYEIVEIVGRMLVRMHIRLAENYIKYQNDEDSEKLFFLADEALKLEICGYEVYQSAVNKLFLENFIGYELGDDSKIISRIDDKEPLLNEPNLTQGHDLFPAKPKLDNNQQSKDYRRDIEETLTIIKNTDLLDGKNVEIVETALDFFARHKYQETLQLLFPSLEYAVNSMLRKAGEEPKKYSGIFRKIEWLENSKHLPQLIKNFTPIIEGRNITLHGNLLLPDDEKVGEAFCLLLIHYLCLLIRKYSATN